MKAYARPIILVAGRGGPGRLARVPLRSLPAAPGPDYSSFCDVSETVSCEAVYQSAYGTVYGVPVAAGGAIWSGLVLLLAARGMGSPGTRARDRQPPAMSSCCRCSVSLRCSTSATRPSSCSRRCACCASTVYVARHRHLHRLEQRDVDRRSRRCRRACCAISARCSCTRSRPRWPFSGSSARSRSSRSSRAKRSRPRAARAAAAPAPIETLDAAQLAEWHAWLDSAAARARDARRPATSRCVLIKFNDYQCPSCRETWQLYQGVIAKCEAERTRGVRRSRPGLPAGSRVRRRRRPRGRRARRPLRCASRKPGTGAGDGGVALRAPAGADPGSGQRRGSRGGGGRRLRRAVPQGARRRCAKMHRLGNKLGVTRDPDVLPERHQDAQSSRGASRRRDRVRASEGVRPAVGHPGPREGT